MSERTSLYLTQLNAAQRKLLQLSVHMNPVIVANVDGTYSLRESAALAAAVRSLLSEDAYRPLLAVAGHEEISDVALRVLLETHLKDIDAYLAQVAKLLEQLPDDVVEAYRRFTLYSIISVAEASRAGLFGLVGERISASEKEVIRKMVDAFKLDVDDEARAKLGM